MTNRSIIQIVADRQPLTLPGKARVREACRSMRERRCGSVLVVEDGRLTGIFTGRDAVRLLASARDDIAATPLDEAATRNPVTMSPEGRAIDALRVMSEGGFRHVPVTVGDAPVGVVSRCDLKGMEIEEFRWRMHGRTHGLALHDDLGEMVATQKPLVLPLTANVAEACAAMRKRHAGSVLGVDDRQRLKGIFTGRDAVRVLASARDPAGMALSRAMTRSPVTLGPRSTPIEALRAMCEGGFRHVPVVDGDRIVGVVSRNDFTGYEIDRLDEEEHLKECLW